MKVKHKPRKVLNQRKKHSVSWEHIDFGVIPKIIMVVVLTPLLVFVVYKMEFKENDYTYSPENNKVHYEEELKVKHNPLNEVPDAIQIECEKKARFETGQLSVSDAHRGEYRFPNKSYREFMIERFTYHLRRNGYNIYPSDIK